MKNKKKKIDVTIKNHLDSKGGHPHVIVGNIDDKHISVGLTTKSRKGKGKKAGKNYPLDADPLGGNKKSYMRRQGTVDVKSNYRNKRSGSMTPKDYDQAKKYGNKAKEKYMNKKK